MSLSGSASDLRSTDSSGNYSFTGLFTGGYVLTPSKPGYNFTPATRTSNNLSASQTANLMASVATYTLSGKVTLNGNGHSGVTVALGGSAGRSTLTDASGNYSFNGLFLGNYFLMSSKAGYSFTPPNATFNALSAGGNARNGPPQIELGTSEGYLLVNGERQPLPIGSSLKNGVFYWLAGPRFLGDYQLVFERPDSSSILLKVAIRPQQFDR